MKHSVIIGLGTKNRPKMLEQALESLVAMNVPDGVEVRLIVCENGKLESCRSIVEEFHNRVSFGVSYLREERDGIVFMRNRILGEAMKANPDYLAFFDDDETVTPNWLIALYNTSQMYAADVVQGHVDQRFPQVQGIELIRRFFPGSFDACTGGELQQAFTNNVLFKAEWVRVHHLKFNERFNLTGGSDSFFFSTLKEMGAKIVFSKEAVVVEDVPESRANIEWIFSRAYRNGYVRFLMNVERYGKVRASIKAVKMVYKPLLICLFQRDKDRHLNNEGDILKMKRCLKAKGMYHAMRGIQFAEYTFIHGN